MAGVGPAVVKGLVKIGAVSEEEAPRDLPYPLLDPDATVVSLTVEQESAARVLRGAVRDAAYGATLLQGVTGSGKTEVYLEAVSECLRMGRQALVLLPEIALTGEFLGPRRGAFRPATRRMAFWHHRDRAAAALENVRRRRRGIGCRGRSALFLPFRDLGLIVVDEEHDTSYKQEEGVLYNARDMAVLRASLCAAPIILSSATPSLETWANVEAGKYAKVRLDARFGAAVLPVMRAIDMRGEEVAPGRWVSPTLRDAWRPGSRGRAVAPVLEPQRLRAGDALSCLRSSDRLSSM